jgi:topoisomerase IV subunit A
MAKGKGVILQRFKDGGLSDAVSFAKTKGLTWSHGDGVRTVEDIEPWLGKRASAGRLPPNGFPKKNKFS